MCVSCCLGGQTGHSQDLLQEGYPDGPGHAHAAGQADAAHALHDSLQQEQQQHNASLQQQHSASLQQQPQQQQQQGPGVLDHLAGIDFRQTLVSGMLAYAS